MKPRYHLLPDPAGIYTFVIFILFVRFVGPKALHDGDTLWHIRFGQIMLEKGQILTRDIFSHTAADQPWVAHEWLSEVIMAFIYNLGGLSGLTITFFLITALTFTILFQTTRRFAGDWITFFVISFATAPMAFTHLLARPHIFSWLLGALTLHFLVRNDRWLWFLPLLTAVWSNLHGGVLLGLVLQGTFLAGSLLDDWPGTSRMSWAAWTKNARRPLLILFLSTLAMGLNPFGYYPLWFNQHVSSEIFASAIGEWKSPDFNTMWYARLWVLGVFILAAWHSRKTSWTWRLLVPMLIYQALGHVRHVSIAAMFISPWMAIALRDLANQIPLNAIPRSTEKPQLILSKWTGPVVTAVVYCMLLGLCINKPPSWQTFAIERFPLPDNYSQGVVDFLKDGAPGQRLLNDYSWGDYLIFALEQPPLLFIDGRADMYGEEIFKDYLVAENFGQDIDQILEKYAIDWVLFPTKHALIRYLKVLGGWKTVYEDEKATILVLAEEPGQKGIEFSANQTSDLRVK